MLSKWGAMSKKQALKLYIDKIYEHFYSSKVQAKLELLGRVGIVHTSN